MNRKVILFISLALLLVVGLVSAVQAYPTRPVTLEVMFSAGGGTDVGARILTNGAEKYLGQSIAVVNKPGASGFVGWESMVRQRPDGYVIGFINVPNLTYGYLDPSAGRSIRLSDFTPIMNHVYDPGVIAVRVDSQFQTVEEVIAYANENPGHLTATSTGVGSDDHLAIMQVERQSDSEFAVVHFRGFSECLAATLGGHVDILFANVGEVKVPMENEEIRVLAILDDSRTDLLPGVPTLEEIGYPVFSGSARGLAGPADMPQEIVEVLVDAFKQAMEEPAHVQRMLDIGLPLRFMAGDEYKEYLLRQEDIVNDLMGW